MNGATCGVQSRFSALVDRSSAQWHTSGVGWGLGTHCSTLKCTRELDPPIGPTATGGASTCWASSRLAVARSSANTLTDRFTPARYNTAPRFCTVEVDIPLQYSSEAST